MFWRGSKIWYFGKISRFFLDFCQAKVRFYAILQAISASWVSISVIKYCHFWRSLDDTLTSVNRENMIKLSLKWSYFVIKNMQKQQKYVLRMKNAMWWQMPWFKAIWQSFNDKIHQMMLLRTVTWLYMKFHFLKQFLYNDQIYDILITRKSHFRSQYNVFSRPYDRGCGGVGTI